VASFLLDGMLPGDKKLDGWLAFGLMLAELLEGE
jgi:hypothetical protein